MAGGQVQLSEVIRMQVENLLRDTRVMLPARVVSFSASSQHPTVSVQVLARERSSVGDRGTSDPVLNDVPVIFPGNRAFRVDHALSDGDLVLLVFCDRSIDDVALGLQTAYSQDPKEGTPVDPRFHDLSDAVAIPFAAYGTSGQVDLLDWLIDVLSTIEAATVTGTAGGDPLVGGALGSGTVVALATLRATIEAVR